jgi:uncharacterized protein YeaO (DUF488 family)
VAVLTKSIFEPKDANDGYRVLITRFYPRGASRPHFDEWIHALSPRPELLFACKKGKIDWTTFTSSLITQLKEDPEAAAAILRLHKFSRTRNITLLCYEKTGKPCHRHTIRDIIDNPKLLKPETPTTQHKAAKAAPVFPF